MEQDKKKILSDLYAIRATMSVVAENDDAIQPNRDAIEELENGQAQRDVEIEKLERTFRETLYQRATEVGKEVEALQNERKECEKKVEDARKGLAKNIELLGRDKKRNLFSYLWKSLWDHFEVGCLLGVILVILIAVGTIISFVVAIVWDREIGYWMGYLYDSLIATLFILAYIFAVCVPLTVKLKKWYIRINENDIDDAKKDIENLMQRMQEIDTEVKRLREVHAAYMENLTKVQTGYSSDKYIYRKPDKPQYHNVEIEKLIQDHEAEIADLKSQKEELERKMSPHLELLNDNAKKTTLIVEEGRAAYPLIDFRDWENVDLIIYYFETGRADDMKEALQLVDRQRQTDQIARAIAMASKEISRTFDDSMRRLGSSLAQSFSVLSRQMARQHAEMMARMDQQTADWREMSEAQSRELRGLREQAAAEMSMQVSAQAMNEALLNKISVSSKHLAEQMDRQMREVHGLY